MGAKGLIILLEVTEDVLEGRNHEGLGLWTQTLLARDELDGWPGLRPYAVMFAPCHRQPHPARHEAEPVNCETPP